MTQIQVQNWKKCISHTKHIVFNLFNVCSNHTVGQESKKQFTIHDSDTHMTLKQGHWTWYKLVSLPKHGYNHAQFERPPLTTVHKKVNIKIFITSGNMSIISLDHT